MTFPTYEEWCEKVAEQAIDGYIINGRTIREWIEILSDELTMLDKIRAEIEKERVEIHTIAFKGEYNNLFDDGRHNGLLKALEIIDKYRGDADEVS